MKVSKVNRIIYGFFVLLPIISCIGYMLFAIFTRTSTIENSQDLFSNCFHTVMFNGNYDFIESTPFYSTINDFLDIFGFGYDTQTGLDYYFTYVITISLAYLGIEVLLGFIQIVRKLVYAFVDKEW